MCCLNYDVAYVERLTKIAPAMQEKLISYYAKATPLVRIEAHSRQRSYSTLWRNDARAEKTGQEGYDPAKVAENFYCGLLAALQQLHLIENAVNRGRSLSEKELDLCNSLRAEKAKARSRRKRRKTPKKDIIENHFFLIQDLLAKNFSWRQIASQYQEFIGISFVYLRREYLKELSRRNTVQRLVR